MWIVVREKRGKLIAFPKKPERFRGCYWGMRGIFRYPKKHLKEEKFPDITWESGPRFFRFIREEWIEPKPKIKIKNIDEKKDSDKL